MKLSRMIFLATPIFLWATIACTADNEEPNVAFTGEIKPVIYVTDVTASEPFYEHVFGFGFDGYAGDPADPYYAEMLAGPQKFGLHEPVQPGDEKRVGRQRLYFRVIDVEAQRKFVESNGGEAGDIVHRAWMDFFTARDPDGNEIVFAVTDPARHHGGVWKREE